MNRRFAINNRLNTDSQVMAVRPEQNKQVVMLALLSKFALVLLLGLVYFCVSLWS
mgnify:CR=1 FL=1